MKTMNPKWVEEMAVKLTCDITDQMANIHLTCVPEIGKFEEQMVMVGVCALIGGDSTFSVRLCAEKSLIVRLVRNMTGLDANDEDVQDYAMEFFNTLCGRFISEIINKNKMNSVNIRKSIQHELIHWMQVGLNISFDDINTTHGIFQNIKFNLTDNQLKDMCDTLGMSENEFKTTFEYLLDGM